MSFILRHAAAAALLLGTLPLAALADNGPSVQSSCAARTKATYGFQCHGYTQVGQGLGLEPVTLVGVVTGNASGVFEGFGTFSSSLGSLKQRVVGQAVFQDRSCFGHIQYRIFLVAPGGGDGPELPPLDIDFAVVNGGAEILGTPNAPVGNGAAVPRMTCRLVKVRAFD